MKFISKAIIAIVGMACLVSCADLSSTDYVPVLPLDLSDASQLRLKELECKDYLVAYPEAMLWVEDKLVVQDRRSSSCLFHKISENGVDEFVRLGNGPEDYLDTNLNPFLGNNGEIGFYDPIKRKVSLLKESNGIYKLYGSVKMDNIKGQVRESIGCDGTYLLTGMKEEFSKHRFLVADSVGNVLSQLGNYPTIEPSLFNNSSEDIVKMLYSASFLRVSPDKQKAVFASYHGALIQFFDLSSLPSTLEEVRSIQLSKPMKLSQISDKHAGWVYGFEDVFATDNNIYAIYNGQTAEENPGFGHYILVFDWGGNLKRTYVAELGIRSLAVDENTGLLYFAGYNEEEMKLYVASME